MKTLVQYINENFKISHKVKIHTVFDKLKQKYNFNNVVNYDNMRFDMRYDLIKMLRIQLIDILNISTNKKVTKRNANTFINIEFDGTLDEYYWVNSDGDTFDYKFKTDGTNTLGEIVLEIAQTYLNYYSDFAKRYNDVDLPDKEYLMKLIDLLNKQ